MLNKAKANKKTKELDSNSGLEYDELELIDSNSLLINWD